MAARLLSKKRCWDARKKEKGNCRQPQDIGCRLLRAALRIHRYLEKEAN